MAKKVRTYSTNMCRCVFCGKEIEHGTGGYAFFGYDLKKCIPESDKRTDHKWERFAIRVYDLITDAFISETEVES